MPKSNKPITSPLKAIRKHCLDCMNNSSKDVSNCTANEECALFPFRFGKNPHRTKRVMTEEQKAAAKIRMQKMWESRKEKPNNAKKEEETGDSPFA